MRTKEILLAFLVLIGVNASAQMNIREYIRFKDTVKVDKFKLDPNGFSCLKLKMNPGEHEILNLNELKKRIEKTEHLKTFQKFGSSVCLMQRTGL
jgi:hypothetical protein